MRLGAVVTTVFLLAAPALAAAQGHGGMGLAGGPGHGSQMIMTHGGVGFGHGGGWGGAWHGDGGFHGGFGHDHFDHDHFFHGRFDHDHFFHDHGVVVGWYPYWGWDCGPYGDDCAWGDDHDRSRWSDDGRYLDPPPRGEAPADAPMRAAAASNECSDWVWRASLRRSVCKSHG
jgi:hypothetical protein